jgi:hypothetical protein
MQRPWWKYNSTMQLLLYVCMFLNISFGALNITKTLLFAINISVRRPITVSYNRQDIQCTWHVVGSSVKLHKPKHLYILLWKYNSTMQLLLYVCMRSVYKYSICQTQQLDIYFERAPFHIGDSKDPFCYRWFAGGNTLVLFNMRVT